MPVPSWGENPGLLTSVVLFLCLTIFGYICAGMCSLSYLHFGLARPFVYAAVKAGCIFATIGSNEFCHWKTTLYVGHFPTRGKFISGLAVAKTPPPGGPLPRCFILLCEDGAVGRAVVKPGRQVTEGYGSEPGFLPLIR